MPGESPLRFQKLTFQLALIVFVVIRLKWIHSPRLISFLWLVVLVKAIVSLTVGSPLRVAILKQPSILTSKASLPTEISDITSDLGVLQEGSKTAVKTVWSINEGKRANSFNWPQVLINCWLIGVFIFLLRYLISYTKLHVIKRSAHAPTPEEDSRYRTIGAQLGIKRLPPLLISNKLESPALAGLFGPMILIPLWLVQESHDSKFDWAIRHELTHWKWWDPAVILIYDLAQILFYFHPATWLVGSYVHMTTTVTDSKLGSIPPDIVSEFDIHPGTRLEWAKTGEGAIKVKPLPSRGEMARQLMGVG